MFQIENDWRGVEFRVRVRVRVRVQRV